MANLVSPGVSVTVTDDSAYASTGLGTIPLFFIGTHEYKTTPSGSIASGTTDDSGGKLFYITSQRELVSTFGNPVFYSRNGTAMHGYELNEYGLHAAYQYLGVSNTAYVIRADIDYAQLVPSTSAPRGEAYSGTIWMDVANTQYGVFQSNGNSQTGLAWDNQPVDVITDVSDLNWQLISANSVDDSTAALITKSGTLVISSADIALSANDTLDSVVIKINAVSTTTGVNAITQYVGGKKRLVLTQNYSTAGFDIGDSSDASILTDLGLFEKAYDANAQTVSDSTKVKVAKLVPESSRGSNGSYAIVATQNDNQLFKKIVNVVSSDAASAIATGVWVKVEEGAQVQQNGKTITPVPSEWQIAMQNCGTDNSACNQVTMGPSWTIPAGSTAGDIWVQTNSVNNGLNVALKNYSGSTSTWTSYTINFYNGTANLPSTPTLNEIVGLYGVDSSAAWQLLIWNGANWAPLSYQASVDAPTTDPEDGTLWYNPDFQVDLMVNLNGNKWVGYRNHPNLTGTDPNGPIVSGSAPTIQSTGQPLVDNDIWIDSADTENYPKMYRYVSSITSWTPITNTDDISPYGVVFADARQDDGAGSTANSSLTVSNFVDPDAPNPELYPDGMILFNTRYSTYNVKQWKPNYLSYGYDKNTDYTTQTYKVGVTSYSPVTTAGRWVTVSGNNTDGSPIMGRKAQRQMIVQAMASAIESNQDVRSENIYFSLIAAPGYCELLDEMVSLSTDKNNNAFVVGDTPIRLAPTGTAIQNYANPTSASAGNTETSITTSSPYCAVYYPWGMGVNVDGTEVAIPPSTIALRTYAYNDNVAYPWYAPAGFTRGLVSVASTVGYLNSDNKFTNVLLNQGQRDALYTNAINPIAYMPGKGLVVYGQKTRQGTTTAMDRVNVARLVCYLNYQLDNLAKPFLFELNNDHTRQSVQVTFTKFFADILNKNGVYDYIVICDSSNNTNDRIDNNELWIDVAFSPEKAIEFIYIPMRIANTGTDLSSLYSTSTGT